MRYQNKYKNHSKSNSFIKSFPRARILKFRRPKWAKLQASLKDRRFIRVSTFLKYDVRKVSYRSWGRLNSAYRNGLHLRNALSNYYDSFFSLAFYKKLLLKTKNSSPLDKNLLALLAPLFRIEILLWKLQFFNSPYEVSQWLQAKRILVNGEVISNSYVVKKGDFISLKDVSGLKYKKAAKEPSFFYNFAELDYYSGQIVILKGLIDLSPAESQFFLRESFSVDTLIDYLRTK